MLSPTLEESDSLRQKKGARTFKEKAWEKATVFRLTQHPRAAASMGRPRTGTHPCDTWAGGGEDVRGVRSRHPVPGVVVDLGQGGGR